MHEKHTCIDKLSILKIVFFMKVYGANNFKIYQQITNLR